MEESEANDNRRKSSYKPIREIYKQRSAKRSAGRPNGGNKGEHRKSEKRRRVLPGSLN